MEIGVSTTSLKYSLNYQCRLLFFISQSLPMSFAPVTVYALLAPVDGTNSITISSDPGQFEGTSFVGNVTLGVLDKTKWKLSISFQYTRSIFITSSETTFCKTHHYSSCDL